MGTERNGNRLAELENRKNLIQSGAVDVSPLGLETGAERGVHSAKPLAATEAAE